MSIVTHILKICVYVSIIRFVGLPKMLFTALLLICLGRQLVASDVSNHRFGKGDIVPFYADRVGPFSNPRETYAYYDLPYCPPDIVKEEKLSLGEMLNGDRLVSTPYKFEFLVDKAYEVLCNTTLSKTDVSKFRTAIEKDYYMQLYFDDLPVWAFIGRMQKNYTNEGTDSISILTTHFDFEVFFNKDRVIEVNLRTDYNSLAYVTEDKEVDVAFTYSVGWKMTQQPFDKRMEKYVGYLILPHHLSVHHNSIAFSSVTLVILVILLLTFYALVLRKDISKYSHDVEETQVAENHEETGWKNIHGDVFRFPKHKSLFAAALGSGTHLLVLIVSILVLGHLGFFPPYVRGVFWNALVIVYAITFVISGYTSVSFYSQLEGTNWMKNVLLAGGLFFVPLVLTFSFLNSIANFYGTTAALPLRGMVILTGLCVFLASPLLLLGGIIGKNRASDFQAPCRTAKCPKEVPQLRWYRGVLPQMALAGILPFSVIYIQLYYIFATVWGHRLYTLYGILCVVFILLLIMTALVSVALTYFQLAVEDHEWWWRSFFCGGSTGFFIYGYCIYYYFYRSDMTGFMQTSFFFGYMACVSYGVFLVLGSVGFRASLLFVRYLYAAIKCD
ncbi:putative nonaspanin (TM9SF) [Helianthus annuus]|nr:putative nonaspanin (TM9SF) [Helianthus annuus]